MKKIILVLTILSFVANTHEVKSTAQPTVDQASLAISGLVPRVTELENSKTYCPKGFVNIHNGKDGKIGKSIGCMQKIENPAKKWHDASRYCFDTFGGRLPFMSEWYLAMFNFEFEGETGNWELTNNIHRADDTYKESSMLVGAGEGNTNDGIFRNVSYGKLSRSSSYRCFISR